MSERRARRRHKPPADTLDAAIVAHQSIGWAEADRRQAFLAAAEAGWTMREIAKQVGLSAATVYRIIRAAELVAVRAERDALGNALAQERAKPGGTWDAAAYEQLAAERDALEASLRERPETT